MKQKGARLVLPLDGRFDELLLAAAEVRAAGVGAATGAIVRAVVGAGRTTEALALDAEDGLGGGGGHFGGVGGHVGVRLPADLRGRRGERRARVGVGGRSRDGDGSEREGGDGEDGFDHGWCDAPFI